MRRNEAIRKGCAVIRELTYNRRGRREWMRAKEAMPPRRFWVIRKVCSTITWIVTPNHVAAFHHRPPKPVGWFFRLAFFENSGCTLVRERSMKFVLETIGS